MNIIKRSWQNNNVKVFVDDLDTIYIRGPFEVDGQVYDYKFKEGNLNDEAHIDYCMEDQMLEWNISMRKDLTIYSYKK